MYKHLSHEAIFILSPALLIVLPSPSSRCHFAGDYILETKPKEISEAQRLNYEQVRPALSLRDFIIFIKQWCALCLWVYISKLLSVGAARGVLGFGDECTLSPPPPHSLPLWTHHCASLPAALR